MKVHVALSMAPGDLLKLDAWAKEHGLSRSAAVLRLLTDRTASKVHSLEVEHAEGGPSRFATEYDMEVPQRQRTVDFSDGFGDE